MKHVVITGFAPFGGESINPSWQAVQHLVAHHTFGRDVTLSALELPVTFADCFTLLAEHLQKSPVDLVLCVGQAGGRSTFCVEKVAINYIHARIPDNTGSQPLDCSVVDGAPTAYFSSLPLAAILHACQLAGVPATMSYSAGTFVCNALFYRLMHFLHTADTSVMAGFIHIPYAPAQVLGKQEPSMTIEMVAQGLAASIRACLNNEGSAVAVDMGTLD